MNGYREAPPRLLVVAFGKGIRGLDLETGEVRWEVEPGPGSWRLHVTGEQVIVAGARQLLALRYPTGEVLWKVQTAMVVNSMLVDGDRIYLAGFGAVQCFGPEGRELWHNEFPGKGLSQVSLALPGAAAQADLIGG